MRGWHHWRRFWGSRHDVRSCGSGAADGCCRCEQQHGLCGLARPPRSVPLAGMMVLVPKARCMARSGQIRRTRTRAACRANEWTDQLRSTNGAPPPVKWSRTVVSDVIATGQVSDGRRFDRVVHEHEVRESTSRCARRVHVSCGVRRKWTAVLIEIIRSISRVLLVHRASAEQVSRGQNTLH